MQLCSPPVNALSLAMCTELTKTLLELEEDHETKGVVLGSVRCSRISSRQSISCCCGDADVLDSDRKCILSSSFCQAVDGVFSAGLDIRSLLVTPDQPIDKVAEFWTAVQDLWLTLYMSPLAIVAAIPGHCPAGGCLLALSCDSRVMVQGRYGIGLNEVKMGLIPPRWFSLPGLVAIVRSRPDHIDLLCRCNCCCWSCIPPGTPIVLGHP